MITTITTTKKKVVGQQQRRGWTTTNLEDIFFRCCPSSSKDPDCNIRYIHTRSMRKKTKTEKKGHKAVIHLLLLFGLLSSSSPKWKSVVKIISKEKKSKFPSSRFLNTLLISSHTHSHRFKFNFSKTQVTNCARAFMLHTHTNEKKINKFSSSKEFLNMKFE